MVIRVLVFTSFFHMSIPHLKYNHPRKLSYKTWLAGMSVSNEHDCIFGFENGDNGRKTWLDAVLGADWLHVSQSGAISLVYVYSKRKHQREV